MKKTGLLLLLSGWWIQAGAAPLCAIPRDNIRIEGLRLGEPVQNVLNRLPGSMRSADSKRPGSGRIDFKALGNAGLPEHFNLMHLAYAGNVTNSFALGDMDEMDTPLTKLSKKWIERYHLPKTGWAKGEKRGESGGSLEYHCRDYAIYISQDYGVGQTAVGATIMMQAK